MANIDITPCLDSYSKYKDTISVAIALQKLVDRSNRATLVGIAEGVRRINGPDFTPDMSYRCHNKEKSALFIDFKWSLTPSTAPSELDKMKMYRTAKVDWGGGSQPAYNDVVMVVHSEVAPIAKKALEDMKRSGDSSLGTGFAIWSWAYTKPHKGGSTEPNLLIQEYEGTLQNRDVSSLIGTNYKVPEEILKSEYASYYFIPEPPPTVYTILFLILNVLPSFTEPRNKKTSVRLSNAVVNAAQRLGTQLLMGKGSGKVRQWVNLAVEEMKRIGLDPVHMPFTPRKAPLDYLCEKLLSSNKGKRRRKRQTQGEQMTLDT